MDITSSARPTVSSSNGLRRFMQRHPLLCYFVMAFGFTWLGWIPYVLSQSGLQLLPVSLSQFASLPGAYMGPLMSGFIMAAVTEGKPGVGRLLHRFVLWRVGWQWYLAALLGVPATILLGLMIMPGAVAALHVNLAQFVLFFPLLLILEICTSGLAEEPGWRGFALPRLQLRYGPLLGSVILGVLWQCWHLPLYLTDWGHGANGLLIALEIIGNVGLTIVITWVFNHSRGSLLIAILMHATLDAFGSVAAVSIFSTQWILVNGNIALLIGFGIVALVLVIVTRGRLGYQQPVGMLLSKSFT
ncbi:CPBP family intramembrane glutamic endopeptidase [Dictyobacter arantiisoli]|uniref:CAAX amino protease n=1 Tax=Dictyobacter arantiisoli TaxID=2014874 RepID=A0A5A5TKN8_9CHLR|nr:CPBP family intramembrane glutamic endopeptidase [Dictyobacter arantiisoli]GCF11646.1 CAAX amino protease [Dictyobacter arantiisoli]